MTTPAPTPNMKLQPIEPTRLNWAAIANNNYSILDSVFGTYFSVNNLKGVWLNSTIYQVGDAVIDTGSSVIYVAAALHTSASTPTTFLGDRILHPTYWTVYSAPAQNKGTWTGPGTVYSRNDFVLANGTKYAFCLVTHTSGVSFDADVALGRWSVLVDLSAVGSLVLPVLTAGVDNNKLVTVNASGSAYIIQSMVNALTAGGATALGMSLLLAASSSAARAALVLGTAAVLDVGTGANQIVQMTAATKLPAVDGSGLTNLPGINSTITYLTADKAHTGPANAPNDVINTGAIGAAGQRWAVISKANIQCGTGQAFLQTSIFDGSVYLANTAVVNPAAGQPVDVLAGAIVTLAGPTTFTMRNADSIGGSASSTTASSLGSATLKTLTATWLAAVRLS